MALWNALFGKKDPAAEVRKLATRATQKFGPPENRQEALQKLAALGTSEALAALTQRWTLRVDPGITDEDEKRYVCDALVEAGAEAVPVLREFVASSTQPTWGLQALERLVPTADVVETVLAALEREGPDWTRDPDKKCTLLRYLQNVAHPGMVSRLVPFFADPSEEVRFAAVSVVMQQEPDPAAHEPLVSALLSAAEQKSDRMRRHLAEALARTGATVRTGTAEVVAALPVGFALDKEGRIRGGR